MFLLAGLLLLAGCSLATGREGTGPDQPVREFHLTSRQFAFAPGEMRVKKGERVRITVTSADVTHGFGIAEYDINRQTPPGKPVTVEFVADKPGRFIIYCTVFCGTGHADHRGMLIVEE